MFGKLILKSILLASNIVAAFFLLITLIGTVVSPEKFIFPAYFALLLPVTIIANIGFVLFWLLARKWLFLISLGLLLFASSQIKDTFPVHLKKTDSVVSNNTLRILSFNTMGCGELKKHTKKKPNKVLQYILDSGADIVCLQEYAISENNEHLTSADINRIFVKYPYKHIEFKSKNGASFYGIATFSKYPIVTKKKIEYPASFNSSIYTDIKINESIIRVVNNHLESNRITYQDKAMPLILKDNFSTESLTGITRHFSHKLGVAYKQRAFQADVVAGVIEKSPYHVIACGDFNDVPASYAYTKVKGKLKDAFSEAGNGFGWTFYDRFYRFRIDYILFDANAFSIIDYKSEKVTFSDHYPVMCRLNYNAQPKISE
jgi:endonuclease/exonuclease/phosphatase family metal-dependent hydrolase